MQTMHSNGHAQETLDPVAELIAQAVAEPAVPTLTHLPLALLTIDDGDGYQRDERPGHVERIVATFDPTRFGVIRVNRRPDGTHWVIDGGHRVRALRQLVADGHPEATGIAEAIPTELFSGLDREGEAAIYTAQRRMTRPLSAYDLVKADYIAGANNVREIDAVLREYGLKLAIKPSFIRRTNDTTNWSQEIQAVAALQRIWNEGGAARLHRAVGFMVATWGIQDGGYYNAGMFTTIDAVLERYGKNDNFDPDRLRERLAEYNPIGLKKLSNEYLNKGSHRLHHAMVALYNKHLKSRDRMIPSWGRKTV